MQNPAVAAGQTVRIVEAYQGAYQWLNGAEFVTERNSELTSIHVPGQGWITCNEWEIVVPEEPINRYTMPVSYEVLHEENERLKRELEHEKAQHLLTTQTNRTLWDDFAKINDALGQEASDRDWCEDYEVFVKGVNAKMQMFSLDLPEIEYEVTVQRTKFVYEQTTVTVSGRRGLSERDLEQAAFEEAWNSYDWDETDSDISDDYEVVDMCEA